MQLLPPLDPSRPAIGLALAGGGPEGAVYEIGALRALEEAVGGLDMTRVPIYVGVSAGAFVGACLANGMSTAQLCRSVVRDEPGETPFRSELFLSPAFGEWLRRGASVPRLLAEAAGDWLSGPDHAGGLLAVLAKRLGRALPVGLFDNHPLRTFLEQAFARPGRTNDFRALRSALVVVAADLDSGEAVRFGEPGRDDVPIATAVQASTALPGLYPPVAIGDRHYVDGVLLKTLHASVALDRGAQLVLCVNPIVPVDTALAVERGVMKRGKLIDRGMPAVLAQTFRTLIHSRLNVGLGAYQGRYGGADVLLFEPRRDDYEMFFLNIFSFASRKRVCEHAYDSTRKTLSMRRGELAPVLARHGLRLRTEWLDEPQDLWSNVGLYDLPTGEPAVSRDLRAALAALEEAL